jgi:hypothetical protein
VLLTKADTAVDAATFQQRAAALQRELPVVIIEPALRGCATALTQWVRLGPTVALGRLVWRREIDAGEHAVGRANAPQETSAIREHDGKGRHTTTSRSIHPIAGGGWVIDTPGMRSHQVCEIGLRHRHVVSSRSPSLPLNAGSATAPMRTNQDVPFRPPSLTGGSILIASSRWRKLSRESRATRLRNRSAAR